MYKYACIKKARTGRNLSHTDSKDDSHSLSWNDEGHAFDYELYQWGVERLFHNSDEAITRELKFYIKEWEKLNIKSKSQISKSECIEKYGSLALYYEDLIRRFIIDHKQLKFDKTDGWTFIGIPEK